MGKRTFFALDIDDVTRGRIAAAADRLRSEPGRINWTKPQNLHVTMNFIGDAPDDCIAELCDLARRAVGGWDAGLDEVTFTIGPLMCFPQDRRARMIWAPVRRGGEVLASLHGAINKALAVGGWRSESRPFKGHVTVARIKSADLEHALGQLPDDDLGEVTATELTLYESKLTPSGPIYTALARIALGPVR
ncbi:MAG: RNA 2',3'-cyclic phosphodiesterase [Phycisphaerae bacterium]|jgi:2'-5' RNA ligase|nr:RNA 2',3'-cyclic phosphodiesterase [Phycisphaerae bacterium]